MDIMRILALSGSLRKTSYNTAAIKALKMLAPMHIKIEIGSIAELPLFDPDRESEHISALEELFCSVGNSDGLVIASPEYAHGISGPMKNTLDWLVSRVEFPNKPIMLINTSPRASHAQRALKEVLTTMSGNIIEQSCISIPLLGSKLGPGGIVENKEISSVLKYGLNEFCLAIEAQNLNNHVN